MLVVRQQNKQTRKRQQYQRKSKYIMLIRLVCENNCYIKNKKSCIMCIRVCYLCVICMLWFIVKFVNSELPNALLSGFFAPIRKWQRKSRYKPFRSKNIRRYIIQGIGKRTRIRLFMHTINRFPEMEQKIQP